jgi:hypothetical protein
MTAAECRRLHYVPRYSAGVTQSFHLRVEALSEHLMLACHDPQVTQPSPSLSSLQKGGRAFALSSKAPTARSFLLKLRKASLPPKFAENPGQTH